MRIITLSIIAVTALLISAMQQSEIRLLRNKLADANLALDFRQYFPNAPIPWHVGDVSNRSIEEIQASTIKTMQYNHDLEETNYLMLEKLYKNAVEYRDWLMAEHAKCITAKLTTPKTVVAVNEKQGAHTMIYVEADSWVDLATGETVPALKHPPVGKDVIRDDLKRYPDTHVVLRKFTNVLGQAIEWIGESHLGTGVWNQ
jgi:hypothetical protein